MTKGPESIRPVPPSNFPARPRIPRPFLRFRNVSLLTSTPAVVNIGSPIPTAKDFAVPLIVECHNSLNIDFVFSLKLLSLSKTVIGARIFLIIPLNPNNVASVASFKVFSIAPLLSTTAVSLPASTLFVVLPASPMMAEPTFPIGFRILSPNHLCKSLSDLNIFCFLIFKLYHIVVLLARVYFL